MIGVPRLGQTIKNFADIGHVDALVQGVHDIGDLRALLVEFLVVLGHGCGVRGVDVAHLYDAVLGDLGVQPAGKIDDGHFLIGDFRGRLVDRRHLHQQIGCENGHEERQEPHADADFCGQFHYFPHVALRSA